MTVHPHPDAFLPKAFVSLPDDKEVLRFIACGSVDDGKSSLIGRLLHDTKQVFADQIASLRQQSRRYGTRGTALDLALLVDGLQSEREQGITIDVAYRFFSTATRAFIVADTPGHEQYTRNMATGASTADAAVILIDARYGMTRQTRRHALLVSMLGVRHVALAVNKMDLVDWSQARFSEITTEFATFAADLGFADIRAIPMSAITGANVVVPADLAWHDGGTLLDFLEHVPTSTTSFATSFSMPVQWVNRPHADFRGLCGLIASGAISVGDPVVVQPSGQHSTIARILTSEGDEPDAMEGQSVTLILADDVDASRGAIIASLHAALAVTDRIAARLFWAAETPLVTGEPLWAKFGTATVNAIVERVVGRVDLETGVVGPANELHTNDIGEVVLTLDRAVALDRYANDRQLGSFILISRETADTAALGLVI